MRKWHGKLTFTALAICALFLSIGICLGQTVPDPDTMPISNVHLTLSGSAASMTVTWQSNQVVGNASVTVWQTRLGQAPPQNQKDLFVAKPVQHTYKYGRYTVNIYDALLNGLETNSSYNYLISCAGATTPVYSFPTPVAGTETGYTFAVMGDCRGNYEMFGKLMRMAREAGSRFVVFTGDMTDGGSQPEWVYWFHGAVETLPYLPLMPLLGNHEMLSKAYFEQFLLPNTTDERNYSFDYGMAHFEVLFDGLEEKSFLAQTMPVLTANLAASRLPWKFIAMHRPPYSSPPDASDGLRDAIAGVAEKSGVSMVFSGHFHAYDRSYPLLGGKQAKDGVVYLVSGGAGATLDEVERSDYTAKAEAIYHLVILDISPESIRGTAKAADGSIIDEFIVARRH